MSLLSYLTVQVWSIYCKFPSSLLSSTTGNIRKFSLAGAGGWGVGDKLVIVLCYRT